MDDTLEWQSDCMRWHGRLLKEEHSHYCADWDYLPIDSTCLEFESCTCWKKED